MPRDVGATGKVGEVSKGVTLRTAGELTGFLESGEQVIKYHHY